ncbi:ficolin-2-like [Asterias rubens]|uniref:ficolin-2-like n=1 Tax=Asterias rubens TaxID=7604 RepID=UPI001455D9AA|nr:ficolin-2-like [Asterias rubens]
MSTLVLTVLFLFAVSEINALGIACLSHQGREFLSAENKELRQVFYRQAVTRSHVQCVSYCHADPQCLSVNYHIDTHLCDQNNATRARYSDHFITHFGSVYFDADVDTPLLSLPDPKPSTRPDTPTPIQPRYSSCKKLLEAGHTENGIFTIFPAGFSDGLRVYCDMETDGGGWIVIQRRQDGSVDFYRNWVDYRVGFGDLDGEFWLGNDNLRNLTEFGGMWRLRIDFGNWLNDTAWSEYEGFRISGENFRLNVDSYNENSTAGDSLLNGPKPRLVHNGMMFSTKDKQNDNDNVGCATKYHGAWWYNDCFVSTLNGRYYVGGTETLDGMHWDGWNNDKTVKTCSMKLRPVD